MLRIAFATSNLFKVFAFIVLHCFQYCHPIFTIHPILSIPIHPLERTNILLFLYICNYIYIYFQILSKMTAKELVKGFIVEHISPEQLEALNLRVLKLLGPKTNKPKVKATISNIHPNKTKYDICLDTVISDGPLFYPNIVVSNGIVSDEIDGVFFNGCADLVIQANRLEYKRREYDSLKFPVDHLRKDYIDLFCLRISVMAYLLEMQGIKIGKLFVILSNNYIEVPYKKWEVQLMLKYYRIQSVNNYAQKNTSNLSSVSSVSNTPVGMS